MSTPTPNRKDLEKIAREILSVDTLEVRGRDRLDFHDIGVSGLVRALEAAYRLGAEDARRTIKFRQAR